MHSSTAHDIEQSVGKNWHKTITTRHLLSAVRLVVGEEELYT